jgi:hypothetical protein
LLEGNYNSLVHFTGGRKFLGHNSITSKRYSSGSVRARVWKACTLPKPTYASPKSSYKADDKSQMRKGPYKLTTSGTYPWSKKELNKIYV